MSSAQPARQPIQRTAGRMFLIDEDERVLLIHDRVDLEASNSHWIAPGGGLEAGETPAEAATREVYEETGLKVALPAETACMYTEEVSYTFAGKYIDQLNHYFLVRVPNGLQVRAAANTAEEKLVGLGHRWWPLAELEASDVVREPIAMVELIRQALAAS